ncbi:MAG: 16S rRNA (cytosine(1402)-N(4))-methyltransferase RsmH [Desulfobacterales bacterium]|nr:16S rRNA (cytosine(1402)-N(4))-methyltransferase RsmH [Desulfobacterales bacterium]
MGLRHIPVLADEVVSLLRCGPHQTYVDATLGGGGHALEILKHSEPDGKVVGIEWDEDALSVAQEILRPFGDRVRISRENFVHLSRVLETLKIDRVDGILLDLGLSSIQLGKKERGFSLKEEGPLDMRMDQRSDCTAADLVNSLSQKELEDMISAYGEDRRARQIAKTIVEERRREPIQTTSALRKIVWRATSRRSRYARIDPATRTFQALRIQVNNELDNLRQILETGWQTLREGGRMCVISFHSLEDRIVKETFRKLALGEKAKDGQEAVLRIVTKKPVTPSEEERRRNPRSRSAKLRCAERVGGA